MSAWSLRQAVRRAIALGSRVTLTTDESAESGVTQVGPAALPRPWPAVPPRGPTAQRSFRPLSGMTVISPARAAQGRLPPVSQHARRHHWHLAARAVGSHDDRDAAHGPAAGTRGAREADAPRVSNIFPFMKGFLRIRRKLFTKRKAFSITAASRDPSRHTSPPGHSGDSHRAWA